MTGIAGFGTLHLHTGSGDGPPRLSANSNVIDVCNRIPHFVSAALEHMGYAVARSYLSYTSAGLHAIKVEGGKWSGGADPGRSGMALEV